MQPQALAHWCGRKQTGPRWRDRSLHCCEQQLLPCLARYCSERRCSTQRLGNVSRTLSSPFPYFFSLFFSFNSKSCTHFVCGLFLSSYDLMLSLVKSSTHLVSLTVDDNYLETDMELELERLSNANLLSQQRMIVKPRMLNFDALEEAVDRSNPLRRGWVIHSFFFNCFQNA
jgi:hypothetical protein